MSIGVLRHVLLVVLIGVIVILAANEVFARTRGASSPEEMVERYITAIRQGDVAAVAWLMRDGQIDEAAIAARISIYRPIAHMAVAIEHLEHSVASYLKGARIRDGRGVVIDEIWMQHQGGRFGERWRLHLPTNPAVAAAAVASPTTPPSPTTCFAPPQPTYLPWGAARSTERITNEKGVEYVVYRGPVAGDSSSTHFSIARAPADRLSPVPVGDLAPRTVSGRQVVIFRVGDPGVGEVAARWQEGSDGCTYSAHLLFPRPPGADEDEIAKIIASLALR